jgi:hypothetical protein
MVLVQEIGMVASLGSASALLSARNPSINCRRAVIDGMLKTVLESGEPA